MTLESKLERSEFHLRGRVSGVLTDVPKVFDIGVRHSLQNERIGAVADGAAKQALQAVTNAFDKRDSGIRRLCTFNLIVALEWHPSEADLLDLRDSFDRAADLLFDVTDAYTTFGRVLVGGPELLGCADIQIFCSNRLYPRSYVNGLNDEKKYQPIRLGRGLWRKNEGAILGWESDTGFHTVVHEFGHYALGLKDQYLSVEKGGVAIPVRNPTKDTIMSGLESSELLSSRPDSHDSDADSEWELLRQHERYSWLNIPQEYQRISDPPAEVPEPAFDAVEAAPSPRLRLSWGETGAEKLISPTHCWVFVLKGSLSAPTALLAQGCIETVDESHSLELLGAASGDTVVLIGNAPEDMSTPRVIRSVIQSSNDGVATFGAWSDATPRQIPQIDVVATNASPPYGIKVGGFDAKHWQTRIFPLGEAATQVGLNANGLNVLDGHVLLVEQGIAEPKLIIACYSLGGNPASSVPAHPNPISAGSSDGNAMLFFYNDDDVPLAYGRLYQRRKNHQPPAQDFGDVRVVTVNNLQASVDWPVNWSPRSYTFSLASNTTFDKRFDRLHPTLVLFSDSHTGESNGHGHGHNGHNGGRLMIARRGRNGKGWELIDTPKQPDPDNGDYTVAAPLNAHSAPGLFGEPGSPDYFRLFLVR